MYESSIFLNSRCSVIDATVSGKLYLLLTTLHAKLFRLLLVLPVWLSSLIDDILSSGLLENLNNWVASISIWLEIILCVRTKSSFVQWAVVLGERWDANPCRKIVKWRRQCENRPASLNNHLYTRKKCHNPPSHTSCDVIVFIWNTKSSADV